MPKQALVFVGIGSLTECADMDRQAWNSAFRAHGLRWDWSWDTYAELMRHGGDRRPAERFASFVNADIDPDQLDDSHKRSFAGRMSRDVPVRPGVAETLSWAAKRSLALGFVSRCPEEIVHPVLAATARARGGVEFDVVLARPEGVRPAPHPDAIVAVLEELRASEGVAVTDSPAGAAAALDAGLEVIAFPGILSEELSFPSGSIQTNAPTPHMLMPLFDGAAQTAAE